jgi:hypothetical protein
VLLVGTRRDLFFASTGVLRSLVDVATACDAVAWFALWCAHYAHRPCDNSRRRAAQAPHPPMSPLYGVSSGGASAACAESPADRTPSGHYLRSTAFISLESRRTAAYPRGPRHAFLVDRSSAANPCMVSSRNKDRRPPHAPCTPPIRAALLRCAAWRPCAIDTSERQRYLPSTRSRGSTLSLARAHFCTRARMILQHREENLPICLHRRSGTEALRRSRIDRDHPVTSGSVARMDRPRRDCSSVAYLATRGTLTVAGATRHLRSRTSSAPVCRPALQVGRRLGHAAVQYATPALVGRADMRDFRSVSPHEAWHVRRRAQVFDRAAVDPYAISRRGVQRSEHSLCLQISFRFPQAALANVQTFFVVLLRA